MFLNAYAIPNLVAFLSIFLLGWFVVLKKSFRSEVGLSFFLLTMSAAMWQLGTFFVLSSSDRKLALLFCHLTYLGSLFIPITTYHFTLAVVDELKKYGKLLVLVYAIGILIFLPLSQTSLFFNGVNQFVWGLWWKSTKLHLAFLGFVSILMTISFYKLWISLRQTAPGIERTRKLYILAALMIAYLGAVDYIPNYGIPVYPFGYLPLFLYFLITAYAIVRYRLLDIEVIIKRTLVFSGIVIASVCAISIPLGVIQAILGRVIGISPFALMSCGIITAVLIYRPLERWLIDITDRYLFQRKFNYHRFLKENAKQIAFIHSLDEVVKQVSTFLIKQARIKNAGVMVRTEAGDFELKYPLGYGGRVKRPQLLLPGDHPFIQMLQLRQSPLMLEQLEKESKSNSCVLETLKLMKFLKAEVLIPSFIGERSNGFAPKQSIRSVLILGQKKSDEPYTDEDLDVFFTVAQDSAIAAERARLFDVVLKEREAKVLAEKKAEMVRYSTTIKHEIKNAVVGVKNAGMNAKIHFLSDIQKLQKQLVELNLPASIIGLGQKIYEEFERFSETVIRNGDKIFVIANTASGLLKDNEAAREQISLKVIWDEAKHVASQVPGVQECRFSSSIPDGFSVFAKIFALEQVLVNLITNASDAMQECTNKRIHLECSYRDVDGHKVAWCELSDSGQGIAPDLFDKIFEEGFSTKRKQKKDDMLASGSGQGLYVCKKKIEEEHQGKIWVESEIGKGAKFVFWIPLKETIEQGVAK